MQLQLTITMLSDWHIGCGLGQRGEIDRLIQRDPDELPYIPAKTLTGIWRDACERVAEALDQDDGEHSPLNQSASWQQWVEYLFGEQPAIAKTPIPSSPRPAALSVRAAHLPEELRSLLQQRNATSRNALSNAMTFIKPGISIDPDNGCTKEDFLRFEEMVRVGTILKTTCELNLPASQDQSTEALQTSAKQQKVACTLLAAGAKLVERLGGKRRRGAGQCKFQLIWSDSAPDINNWDLLDGSAPSLPKDEPVTETASSLETSGDATAWKQIALTLEAVTPIVIPARTIGNVVETLNYIPGTHLLRIVLQRLRSLNIDLSDAVGQGDLLVTNATMAIDDQPGRSVPACLFYEKLGGGFAKGGIVYNRFLEVEPETQLKGYRGGYISAVSDPGTLPVYQTVNTLVGTHNTIKDEVQRPTSEVGGVYSYEAIAPKTILRAEIRLRQSIDDALNKKQPEWWKKLKGSHRIGQSKKDDYGAVNLTVEEIAPSIQTEATVSELAVWILSDVLLRDERLRPSTSLKDFQRELEKELNDGRSPNTDEISLELRSSNESLLSAMPRSHRIESWQVRWNLPRPSLIGIAAGSCMMFKVTSGTLNPERLRQLEFSGIGERRAEGYGQLCFNHPLLSQSLSHKFQEVNELENQESQTESEAESTPASNLQFLKQSGADDSDPTLAYTRLIETAAWREAIRRAALFLASTPESRENILGMQIIQDDKNEPKGEPSMSQLGALQSVVSQLRSPSSENTVTHWISSIHKKKIDKWDKTNDGLNKVYELVTKRQIIWQHISIALHQPDSNQADLNYPSLQQLTLTQNGEATLKQELWAEAVQILVDACIRAHKRDLEEAELEYEQSLIAAGAGHGT